MLEYKMNKFNIIALILPAFYPLFFGTMGGILSERVGIINIALEGFLLTAAFTTGVVYYFTHSLILSMFLGSLASGFMGILHWYFTKKLNLNHIISGLGINIFVSGFTIFMTSMIFNEKRTFSLNFEGNISFLFFILFIITFICVYIFLFRTKWGLHYRSVGENPFQALTMGIKINKISFMGLFASGFITGIGGSFLVLQSGTFVKDISSGRGYIALAAVIFGGWKPLGATIGALIFASFEWIAMAFQGGKIPTQLISMLPYLITIIALVGVFRKSIPPANLGK